LVKLLDLLEENMKEESGILPEVRGSEEGVQGSCKQLGFPGGGFAGRKDGERFWK
jgi:hypothetical protein